MRNVTSIALDRSIASTLSHKTYSGQGALTIGAIGVVLGIRTSPLYAGDQIFIARRISRQRQTTF